MQRQPKEPKGERTQMSTNQKQIKQCNLCRREQSLQKGQICFTMGQTENAQNIKCGGRKKTSGCL